MNARNKGKVRAGAWVAVYTAVGCWSRLGFAAAMEDAALGVALRLDTRLQLAARAAADFPKPPVPAKLPEWPAAGEELALRLRLAQELRSGPGPSPSPGGSIPRAPGVALPDSAGGRQSAAESGRDPGSSLRGSRWGLAPVRFRWWGSLGSSISRVAAEGQNANRSRSDVLSLNAAASSYIWQPWFATVDGNMGLNLSHSAASSQSSSGVGVTGAGKFRLFPVSRFPFEAMAEKTDSRTASELVANNYQLLRLGLRQSYRNPIGDFDASGGYDRSTITSDFGEDVLNAFTVGATKRFGRQSLSANANLTTNEQRNLMQDSRLLHLSARHAYRPSDQLTIDSDANLTRNRFNLQSGPNRTEVKQLSSFGVWRPSERPMTVTAGLRAFGFSNASGGNFTDTDSLNLNAGLNYDFSRNLRGSAGGNVNKTGANVTTNQTGILAYQADPRPLANFTYNWGANGSVSNQTGGGGNEGQTAAGTLTHSAIRGLADVYGGAITVNLSQAVSAQAGIQSASGNRISHGGSVSWGRSWDTSQAYLSLSASDSRAWSGEQSVFQLINLQATLNSVLTRYSSWNGNLTVQATRQQTPAVFLASSAGTGGFTVSTSGNLSYVHSRVFGVPRLSLTSNLRSNATQYSRLEGNLGATPNQETWAWDNRLRYQIGRTYVELRGELANINGRDQSLLFLQLRRDIGF